LAAVRGGEAGNVLKQDDRRFTVRHLVEDARELPEHAGLLSAQPSSVAGQGKVSAREGCGRDVDFRDLGPRNSPDVAESEIAHAVVGSMSLAKTTSISACSSAVRTSPMPAKNSAALRRCAWDFGGLVFLVDSISMDSRSTRRRIDPDALLCERRLLTILCDDVEAELRPRHRC
jgi:hypothetical protein